MVKSIEIKNFQSHKNSVIEFSDGVNVIVGSSDNGKSAIFRAFEWVRTNKPSSNEFVSHWAFGDKSQKEECSVSVVVDDNQVTRLRGRDKNQYIVNNHIFEAFRNDLPEEVKKAINLDDISVQKQLDEPFLLSMNSMQCGRYLNSVIDIDIIDKCLSYTDNKKRSISSKIEELKEKNKKIEKEIEKKNIIEMNDKKIIEIENCEKEIEKCEIEIEKLKNGIEKLERFGLKIGKLEKLKIEDVELKIRNVEELKLKIENLNGRNEKLKNGIGKFEKLKNEIGKLEKLFIDKIGLLPRICPLCGAEVKNEVI